MKNIVKRTCLLLLATLLFAFGLCGCADSDSRVIVDEKYIETELQERYGMEFVCDSVKYSQHMYKAICHPKDDSSLSFSCMYGEDGSFGYDYYVGAIISKEEERLLSNALDSEFGDIYVRCGDAMIIGRGYSGIIEDNTSICDLIKNGIFTIDKAYSIQPISRLSFSVFINKANQNIDYGKEYEIFETAVDELVARYKNDYGLDIYADMYIYFMDDSEFESIKTFYDNDIDKIQELINEADYIPMQMGTPSEHVTDELWLTKDEYIEKRKEIE